MSEEAKELQKDDLEIAFIACLCASPAKRIPEAEEYGVQADWLTNPYCRLYWAAVEELREEDKKPDGLKLAGMNRTAVTLYAQQMARRKGSPFSGLTIPTALVGKFSDLRKGETDEKAELANYMKMLRDAWQARATGQIIRETAGDLDAMMKGLGTVQQATASNGEVDVAALIEKIQGDYDRADYEFNTLHNYNFIPGIPFPWEAVNHLTTGLNPGLHVIAARPSVGKTSFVLQCMTYWCALGYRVGFNGLDMAHEEMLQRPMAILSRVPMGRMKKALVSAAERALSKKAGERVTQWFRAKRLMLLNEDDVDRLAAWAERRHEAGGLDILIIDFAQRFRLKRVASEYETVTYVSGRLKKLANECNLPVILLSQLSRDNMKAKDGPRPPELSDLRGSGALEQDATSVVLLHKVAELNDVWREAAPYCKEMQGQVAVTPEVEEASAELDLLVPTEADDTATVDARRSLAAVSWRLEKNQNGATGEVPFLVYQNCFRWYVGNPDASGKAKYKSLTLDWRAAQEPLKSAKRNGVTIEPTHWANKYAEELGRLGLSLPDITRHNLPAYAIERYEKLRAEHDAKLGEENPNEERKEK